MQRGEAGSWSAGTASGPGRGCQALPRLAPMAGDAGTAGPRPSRTKKKRQVPAPFCYRRSFLCDPSGLFCETAGKLPTMLEMVFRIRSFLGIAGHLHQDSAIHWQSKGPEKVADGRGLTRSQDRQ